MAENYVDMAYQIILAECNVTFSVATSNATSWTDQMKKILRGFPHLCGA